MEKAMATDGQRRGREADRIALVDQLWKLKKYWQEHTGAHIPLNVLIKETEYRRDVLDGAERSGKPELADLARRIRDIEQRLGEISRTVPPSRPAKLLWSASLAALAGVAVLAVLLVRGGMSNPAAVLPAGDATTAFRMHGSNTIGEELAPALLQAFYRSRGATETLVVAGAATVENDVQFVLPARPGEAGAVEIHAHGSSTAFQDLLAGTTDLGMSSRAIKAGELAALAPRYGNLAAPGAEHVIALDGLAVIVHAANPVSALRKADVAAIFAGKVTNWSALGGNDLPITLYARDDNSGTLDTFKSLVLDPADAELAAQARRFESSTELSDSVAADPGGIGFTGLPYVRDAKALGIAESAGTLPIVPTEFTVSTEDYPLARRLYFYMPGNTDNTDIREFVEFTLSDAGQAVVEKVGLISQRVRTEPVRPRDDAPPRFLELTRNAERLSVTLRFASDGSRLENKSARDIVRVVDFMKEHRGRRLLLLGFAEATNDPVADRALSDARARTVAQMFAARGIHAAAAEGLGGALPVASGDAPAGQLKNRRVEVWLLQEKQ